MEMVFGHLQMVYKMLYTLPIERNRADPSGSALTVPKFMLSMKEKPFAVISSEAKNRGVTVQELLRAVIVPEWARENLQPSTIAQTSLQITPHQIKPSMSSKQRDSKLAITVGQLRT
jgi:hypothetical protein